LGLTPSKNPTAREGGTRGGKKRKRYYGPDGFAAALEGPWEGEGLAKRKIFGRGKKKKIKKRNVVFRRYFGKEGRECFPFFYNKRKKRHPAKGPH